MNFDPASRRLARLIRCLAVAKNDPASAAAFAASQRWNESADIERTIKAAVAGMTESSDTSLTAVTSSDLADLVKKKSIVGRLGNFRRVPARTRLFTRTAGVTAAFIAPGAAGRISAHTFSQSQFDLRRVAGGSVVTRELVMSATRDAENFVSDDIARALAEAMDAAFIDPNISGSPDLSPGSVTSSGQTLTSGL